jgi:hypothetical protein
MIRRDDGRDWLLISQVDHARLAGEIAAVWGSAAVPSLPVPELLVPAVRDHDEGWRDWERRPQVDPDTGRPRDFTEMPMAVSTAIWGRSIEACAGSPLGGLWVSLHFCWLAEKAWENRRDRPEELAAVESFLDDQAARQQEWKRQAAPLAAADELDGLIETGSHRASAIAVAEGRADVAAIDCRTWSLLQRCVPEARALIAVGWTAPRKGLPYIRSASLPAREAAILDRFFAEASIALPAQAPSTTSKPSNTGAPI